MFAVVFFRTLAGNEPARDFLRELPKDDKLAVGSDLKAVQFGFPIGMPLCRPLRGGLHEVRTKLPSGRECRTIFFQNEGRLVIVHAFIKKTQKTPKGDIDLASARKSEYERNTPRP